VTTESIDLWAQTLEQLKLQMTQATFDTWLRGTTGHLRGSDLVVTVKNGYAVDWLTTRLRDHIIRTLARVAGREVAVRFQVADKSFARKSPPSHAGDDLDTQGTSFARKSPDLPPGPGEIAIELIQFDPSTKGWVPTPNYAIRFWQPYLIAREQQAGAQKTCAFNLWLTLRSFAWIANREAWPSVETLASICAGGNRHAIVGRSDQGRIGALQILEREWLVHVETYGQNRQVSYKYRVLDSLPLLTRNQVETLPETLQKAHERFIKRCDVNYQEWEQLKLNSILEDHG
jgi:hypothetical protein